MTQAVVSLRKLGRVAPGLLEPTLVTHAGQIVGEFIPRTSAPRSAQLLESVGPSRIDAAGPSEAPSNGSGLSGSALSSPGSRASQGGASPRRSAQVERDAVLRGVNRRGSPTSD